MCRIMVTEEQLARIKANTERFKQAEAEAEAREKSEARKSWVKLQTCPHCGQCPPLPVWLMG
jgi:ferredoxin